MPGGGRASNTDVKALIKLGKTMGFSWDGKLSGKGHIKLVHEGGGFVTISGTPSTRGRWKQRVIKDMERVVNRSSNASL